MNVYSVCRVFQGQMIPWSVLTRAFSNKMTAVCGSRRKGDAIGVIATRETASL